MASVVYLPNSPPMEGGHVFEIQGDMWTDEYDRLFSEANNWCVREFGPPCLKRWRAIEGDARRGADDYPSALIIFGDIDAVAFRLRWC